jgi:iron complex outermembrane receptor protein
MTLASSQVVLAQQANDRPVEKVVITGSSIKRIEGETAAPVQVIKAEEIRRLGVASVRELLDTITSSNRDALSDTGGSNSFASGASSVSLRSLGKMSTLVLLNSRRVAPYALADYNEVFTNLDSLPLDAIEQVQILKNGGSSIYGSDAVAGVINIITRSDFHGVQLAANRDQSIANEQFHKTTASITAGFGDLATDRYNVLANLELFQRGAVMWRDVMDDMNPVYGKKFTAVADKSGQMFGNRGAPSSYSYPGNLIGVGAIAGCPTISAAGLCVYDRFSRFEAQPKADRANLLVSGKLNINADLQGFTEVLYSHTKTVYQGAYSTYGSTLPDVTWGNPATGEGRTFSYRYLPATHPLNPSGDDVEFRYRWGDQPGATTATSDEYRVLAGLRGSLGKYDWETAAGVMGSKTQTRGRNALSDSGFKQMVGDYTKTRTITLDDGSTYQQVTDPNFFNHGYKIGKPNSPEVLNALFPNHGYDGKISQYFVDAKVTGEVGDIGGRPIGFAVGGDLRHEKFDISPTADLLAGDIVGNGASVAKASRSTSALFSELSLPVTTALEVTAAARLDKFPGFQTHASPKLAARLEASKQLIFRGTVESGFRAPNLTESADSSKFSFSPSIRDPKRCDQTKSLANDLRTSSDALPASDPNKQLFQARADLIEGKECSTSVFNTVHNNPDLKPEVSRSSSLGFVLEPIPGTTVSVDYFQITRKDEIASKDTKELLASESSLAPGVIVRRPLAQDQTFSPAEQLKYGVTTGPLTAVNGKFENVSKTKTSGVDIAATSRIDTPLGRLNLSANGTYLLDLRSYFASLNGGSYGDNLAGRYTTQPNSKLVANVSAALKTGEFTNSLRATYNSGVKLQGDYFDDNYSVAGCKTNKWTEAECHLASYTRLDYNVSYTGIKNLTVSMFIRNVLGRRPPVDLKEFDSAGGVIPQSNDDVIGRSIRISAEYRFR